MPPHEPTTAPSASTPSNRALSTDKRRERIIELLTPLFLERGYENVSMNEIIGTVGGSKATIYSLFGNKSGLFEDVVRQMTRKVTVAIDVHTTGTLQQQLTSIGHNFLESVLSPNVLEFHRLMVAMGKTFPSATSAFYETGPMLSYTIVGDWLAEQQELGRVRPGDSRQMAVLFLDMLIGEYQLGRLTGKLAFPRPEELNDKLQAAVEMFVQGFGTSK